MLVLYFIVYHNAVRTFKPFGGGGRCNTSRVQCQLHLSYHLQPSCDYHVDYLPLTTIPIAKMPASELIMLIDACG
jgi:hypothetical protein